LPDELLGASCVGCGCNPVPQKTDAEAWKDKFFKQHPDADTNKDGVLSWPEFKAYKAKLDAEKANNKPQP